MKEPPFAQRVLETHGELRDSAYERSTELKKLEREVREVAGRLKKIARAVSEEQLGHATEAVRACLPAVSQFFSNVARNPDFTGLEIEPDVVRDKVSYKMRATSAKLSTLDDAVGHVLSGGDLSAAGMALLLGLASGREHHLGFLLLDDPAESMDPVRQGNFAEELARIPDKPQMIILTHQPDFAANLAARGAVHQRFGRWEGGRNYDS